MATKPVQPKKSIFSKSNSEPQKDFEGDMSESEILSESKVQIQHDVKDESKLPEKVAESKQNKNQAHAKFSKFK